MAAERGEPDLSRPGSPWITDRMTHVYCPYICWAGRGRELAGEG